MINTLKSKREYYRIESFAEHFLSMSPDLMILVTMEGAIEYYNDAWIHVSGYTRQELDKQSLWALTHPDDLEGVKNELSLVANGGTQKSNYESRLVCKNGSILVFAWSATVDYANRLIYAVGRDITELVSQRQILQDKEQKFEFLSHSTSEGVCIHTNGKIQLANKAFYTMFGFNSEIDVIGKSYTDFVADNELKNVKKRVQENFVGVYESKGKTKNGDFFPIQVRVQPIYYKGSGSRIATIRNLSEEVEKLHLIKKSELLYHSVFQNQAVGILLVDKNAKFIKANSFLLDMLGYTEDEFPTLHIADIMHKADLADAASTFQYLLETKQPCEKKQRRFIKKDNSEAWANCTSTIITVDDGEEMVMIVIEDIATQKNIEQALSHSVEKLRAVYEGSPMGILLTVHPGIIIDINATFANMLGYTQNELIGRNIMEFTHHSDMLTSEKVIERVYNKRIEPLSFEKKYIRKDGSVLWARVVVSQIHADDSIIAVAIIENIEKNKKTEHSLEMKNRELLHINQELEHFAYVASHDLQEPLRTITSFIQILDKRYSQQLDDDGRQFMGYVVEGSKRMQNLIRDLLEYSRINRFNTPYEKVDLNEVFQTVNRVLKEKIDSNDAIVLSEHLPVIYGSKMQITQVFQNMIDNAIKFRGKKKPEIEITVQEHIDKWEFAFKDNGIGISSEYYQRIFVIFQRLHTHEEYTGTGIGLAICKKIVERHGGNIWLHSKPGKGTTFYFTIAKNITTPINKFAV